MSVVVILAGCNMDVPEVNADWCYTFYFGFEDYDEGVNIISGHLVDYLGYRTDNGDLSISYTHPRTVMPALVVVTASRAGPEAGTARVSAAGEIFGITTSISQDVPEDYQHGEIPFTPPFAGIIGSVFNLTVKSDKPVYIHSIEVSGTGANPFDDINCDEPPTDITPTPWIIWSGTPVTLTPSPTRTPSPTETPTPITDTPSPTITPSPTLTPSITQTPSATSTCAAGQILIDFDTHNSGYTVASGRGSVGSYGGGSAMLGSYFNGSGLIDQKLTEFIVDLPDHANVTRVRFFYEVGFQGAWYVMYPNGTPWKNANIGAASSGIADTTAVNYVGDDHGDQIRLALHNGQNSGMVANVVDDVIIDYCVPPGTSTPTFTPTESYTASPITPSSTASRTRLPTRTLGPGETPAPTLTPFAISSPWTASPSQPPSRTSVPIVVPYTPPPLSTLPPAFTNTPFGTPYGTPATGTMTPEEGTGTAIPGTGTPTTATPDGSITPIFVPWNPDDDLPYSPGDDETSSGIVGIGGGLISFGSNFMQRSIGYLREVIGQFTNIITAWRTTPPMPIPQAWDCVDQSLASEVCAIFYILRYTIFGGTLGQINLAVALVITDLWIIFNFIRLGRAILARAAEILKV